MKEKNLKLNPDYAKRHLFVTLLMIGLCGWFGYDGFVRYPSLPAAELYREIEKADPPASLNLEAFKRQKTQTQYGFTFMTLLVALVVGTRLGRSARLRVAFDETGFEAGGKTYPWSDVKSVDRAKWASKGILRLTLADGSMLALDAWHHLGVKDFEALLAR